MTPRLKAVFGLVLFGALLDAVRVSGAGCYLARGECPHLNVSFYLRTKDNTEGTLVTLNTIESAPFVEGLPLVVLVHGYTGHRLYSPNMELVPAYLQHGGYNILTVDWGNMASVGCYIQAAFNVEVAGRCAAHFLRRIYELRGPQWKLQTHVIGFSLGAHVSGVLGYNLPGLPRITGLDPALPLFSEYTSKAQFRLDETDADFVDVYHSNAGWKGRVSPVGHLDFYINNGRNQPGCGSNSSCDHVRAVEVFAESINSRRGFFGVPCTVGVKSFLGGAQKEACVIDEGKENIEQRGGENADFNARGTYRIDTNDFPPYAKGSKFPVATVNANTTEVEALEGSIEVSSLTDLDNNGINNSQLITSLNNSSTIDSTNFNTMNVNLSNTESASSNIIHTNNNSNVNNSDVEVFNNFEVSSNPVSTDIKILNNSSEIGQLVNTGNAELNVSSNSTTRESEFSRITSSGQPIASNNPTPVEVTMEAALLTFNPTETIVVGVDRPNVDITVFSRQNIVDPDTISITEASFIPNPPASFAFTSAGPISSGNTTSGIF